MFKNWFLWEKTADWSTKLIIVNVPKTQVMLTTDDKSDDKSGNADDLENLAYLSVYLNVS